MLKCPDCGRSGGPFRLRHQIQADGQLLRGWTCPCGTTFHATAGAERPSASQAIYSGFTVEWNGKTQAVSLKQMSKHETIWAMGPWTLAVAGPPDGPGTRVVTLLAGEEESIGEWRLQPGWGPSEIGRRLKVWPLPSDLSPELLARVIVRVLG